MPDAVVLADVVRSGMVESRHRGHAVVVAADGQIVQEWGDARVAMFPRSSIKPVQASGMVDLGLVLPPDLLALAAASHSGERAHLDGVRLILSTHGLSESALQNPADQPYDPVARDERIRAGLPPEPLVMNCSGKHAAMLATCRVRGWPTETYLRPDHPLQVGLREHIETMAGEPVAAVAVDGCGAPLLAMSLAGLARAVSRCVTAEPGSPPRRVADAMRRHPDMVGGSRRDVTDLMRGVPGILAKDGAEGVYVVALPDGQAAAVKIEDGGQRARPVIMAALLARMGVRAPIIDAQAVSEVLGGGRRVGGIDPVL